MIEDTEKSVQIVGRASYSLELRRKAWEIILTHLSANGTGHGSYLKLVQNSIVAAQKAGTEIVDYKGNSLDAEAISKDDLFGFLGSTKNPKNGPRRRISDYKFAVLDAYFCLIREPMWLEFDIPDVSTKASLHQFWKPEFPLDGHFFGYSKETVYITSSSFLRQEIEHEKSSRRLRRLDLVAIRIHSFDDEKIFRFSLMKFPISSEFIANDDKAHAKVRSWCDEFEESSLGVRHYLGYGAFCDDQRNITIASAVREVLTRRPCFVLLSLSMAPHLIRGEKWGSKLEDYDLYCENIRLDPYFVDQTGVGLSSPVHSIFSEEFLQRVRRTVELNDNAGCI